MTKTKSIELILETVKDILGVEFLETVNGKELKFWIDGGKKYLDSKDCSELAELFSQCAAHLDPNLNQQKDLKNKIEDLYWHCKFCGDHEKAESPYELGDKEPCITCGQGTAQVMTTKEAAKFEAEIARGIRSPERSYDL
jgi:hypothetical protein